MPKILIDLERLRYPYSGIANVFRNLAQGLHEKNKDFHLFYYGVFSTLNFNPAHKIQWKNWHKFLEFFSPKFDLIHVSHQLSSYFHRNYRSAIKIVTLHDLNFLHENLSKKKKKKMLKKVSNNLKTTDYIVCISQFAKLDFEKNKHLFQLKKLKNTVVIHNGIQLPEQREYDLGRFSFLKNKNYILNIGVLFEKKNQLLLVEMLPYINQDLVLLASDQKEPYASNLKQKIIDLELEHRVTFLKGLTEEEKYAAIQNCDALCHPSIAEGFGIPPIEAMAFGKPVFLSTATSLPEIGGDVAFYFEDLQPKAMAKTFREKMQAYKIDESNYQENLKSWIQQFDYKVMTENYLALYQKLLSK